MRILEAVNCCHAVANYMRDKDESPKCGHDLHEVANLVQEQQETIERQAREIEILRRYGNKDCTAMADEALQTQEGD